MNQVFIREHAAYCKSKKSWPNILSNYVYSVGQDFLDTQYSELAGKDFLQLWAFIKFCAWDIVLIWYILDENSEIGVNVQSDIGFLISCSDREQ